MSSQGDPPVQPEGFVAGRFQKGVSGNPKGKPVGLPSFSAALRRELAKSDRRNVQHLERIARKVVAMAMAGDMDAVRWLADRVDGKVAQNLNVSNEHTVNVVPWLPAVSKSLPKESPGNQIDVSGDDLLVMNGTVEDAAAEPAD